MAVVTKYVTTEVLFFVIFSYTVVESILLPSSITYVRQGDKFVLTCKVPLTGLHLWLKDRVPISASPANRYRFDQEQTYSENKEFYTIMKLTVDLADVIHSGEYKCNSLSPHSQHIVVLSENMIKTNEEESGKGLLLAGNKKNLILQCNTTECEHCNVKWLKDGEEIDTSDDRVHIYDENNSVIINHATEKDTGNYMCIVDKQVIGHVINTTIAVRTKTVVKSFPRSINSVQGNKLTLYCNITSGSPTPTIVWYKDGQLLNDSDNHIKINDDDERGIKDSYLIIEELEYSDRAHYTCEAENAVNSANSTVFVRVKDKLAALWPFLGICAEVAILCTIIFVYEKRKVKETEESDTDNNPESKSIPDRGRSQDIRQRK